MADAAPQQIIRRQWERWSTRPFGRTLFSRLIGLMVPYSGSIGARVEALAPGHARVTLKDRRKVRNHLRSIHAVALLNLGELTSGLALNFALPADARSILVGLSMEYRKKARGTLTATCDTAVPERVTEEREMEIEAEIRDVEGDVVAVARARWRVGPREPRGQGMSDGESDPEHHAGDQHTG